MVTTDCKPKEHFVTIYKTNQPEMISLVLLCKKNTEVPRKIICHET